MLICILGNSHAAALKHGWDLIAQGHPDVELHFFSMLGQNLGRLILDGETLRLPDKSRPVRSFPEAAGGAVDIGRYDAFILYGLGLHAEVLEPAAGVSRACHDCVIADSVRATAAWSLLSDIRKVSAAPVLVGATPLRAAEKARSRGADAALDQNATGLARLFAEKQARFLSQPAATIVNGDETDPAFNMGVVPIAKDAAEADAGARHKDRVHMNAAYGRLVLEAYLDHLKQAA